MTCRSWESRRRLGQATGFTLVEVVVAILLLAMVLLGLAVSASVGARQLTRSRMVSLATIVGREEMERLAVQPYGDLAVGSRTTTVSAGHTQFTVVAVVTERYENLKDIKVTVDDQAGHELQRFRTSVYREVAP